eukprot:6079548-Prymnesium_polylepis.1
MCAVCAHGKEDARRSTSRGGERCGLVPVSPLSGKHPDYTTLPEHASCSLPHSACSDRGDE